MEQVSPQPPWRPADVTDFIRHESTRDDIPLDWTDDGPMPQGAGRVDIFVAIPHPREDGAVQIVVLPVKGIFRHRQDGRA